MKFVFFYPYYTEKIRDVSRVEFPPLGMLYVCAVLEKEGCEVSVFPLNKDTDLNSIPEADVYAYTITATVTYSIFQKIVPQIKHKAKLHIAGNTLVNTFTKKILKELNLDAVFIGESEASLIQWYKNGCIEKGIIQTIKTNIKKIPFPARHLLPNKLIYLDRRVGGLYNHSLSIISSRGCSFSCSFCAINNKERVYYRDLNDFENEIIHIKENYPKIDGIVLMDETFTFNQKHAIKVASILKKHNLPWECNSRVDTLPTKVIKALVDSNCQEVRIGIETGSQELLDKMNKETDIIKAAETIKEAADLGLPIKLYLMHGFPGENMETTQKTIDFITDLHGYINRISLYRFTPLAGSPVYESGDVHILDFDDYTIYDNSNHWFGTDKEFEEVKNGYQKLSNVISELFD